MNLIIDAGNTCLKLAAYKGDDPVEISRMDYDELEKFERFAASYPFRRGIVSSVVDIPQAIEERIKALSLNRGPGEILPPTYSPSAFTKSYVMHVPTSITSTSLPPPLA